MANTKTTTNEPQEEHVSIGVEHFFIAPQGTTFSATSSGPACRVNITSPPAGFLPLGAVDEGTVSVTYNRSKFELIGGVLKVKQKTWVTEIGANLNFTLRDCRGKLLSYMLGNGKMTNVVGTTLGTDSATVSSVVSRQVIWLASYPTSIVAGNDLVFSTASSLTKSYNEGRISSVTSGASGVMVTLVDSLDTVPVANELAAKLFAQHNYAGTTVNNYYVLLGVADLIDGQQIQHFASKVAPMGDWTEEIRPDAVTTIPCAFEAFGQEDSQVDNEAVVLRRTDVRTF